MRDRLEVIELPGYTESEKLQISKRYLVPRQLDENGLTRQGFRLVSGGTDNHLLLVDVTSRGLTGKECQAALDEAGITINKNTIPFETRSPFQASGIRLGQQRAFKLADRQVEPADIGRRAKGEQEYRPLPPGRPASSAAAPTNAAACA